MPGSIPFRGRRLVEIASVLIVYLFVAAGAIVFAGRLIMKAPDPTSIEESLPFLVLCILPLSSAAFFVFRLRSTISGLRARRYGSRLKARLAGLFVVVALAASLPQGFLMIKIVTMDRSSPAATLMRDALAAGEKLSLAWYAEELDRAARAAKDLHYRYASASEQKPDALSVLNMLRGQEHRVVACEIFSGDRSADFAGEAAARMSFPPLFVSAGSAESYILPSAVVEGESILRFVAVLGGEASTTRAVISFRLPADLEYSASLIGKAERSARLMIPFGQRWTRFVILLCAILLLPFLFLAMLLGLVAADFLIEPVVALEEATKRVASGDFSFRLIAKNTDETGTLLASFNRMLDEINLRRSDERRKEKIDAWKDIAQRLAHELKNPLTPIRLAAERVLRRWEVEPDSVGSIIKPSMMAVVKEVEGMDAMLSDFRSFASLPEPRRDWVDLKTLVEDSVALYAASYPGLRFEVSPLPVDVMLRLDAAAIKRALANLLKNAVDATGGSGIVEIGVDLVKESDSNYCRLRVRDNGLGIAPDARSRIFVPYFTTKPDGTGLGLAIVERIVRDHGGSIRFESEEGLGATFFVDLPIDA